MLDLPISLKKMAGKHLLKQLMMEIVGETSTDDEAPGKGVNYEAA